MKNPALNKILKHLKNERKRFLKAFESGEFCDGEHCLLTSEIIKWTIWDLENYMSENRFDIEDN